MAHPGHTHTLAVLFWNRLGRDPLSAHRKLTSETAMRELACSTFRYTLKFIDKCQKLAVAYFCLESLPSSSKKCTDLMPALIKKRRIFFTKKKDSFVGKMIHTGINMALKLR